MLFRLPRYAFSLKKLQIIKEMRNVNFDDMHNLKSTASENRKIFRERLKEIYAEENHPQISLKENFLYGFELEDFENRPNILKQSFCLENATSGQILKFKIQKAIEKYRDHAFDTASLSVRVAVLSEKIIHMVSILSKSRKDKKMLRKLDEYCATRTVLLSRLRIKNPNKYIWLVREYKINHSQTDFVGYHVVKLEPYPSPKKQTRSYTPQDTRKNLFNHPCSIKR